MGCNLSLLQLFLLRELAALFYGTEMMIVALLCSYFFGQALGFLAYRWLAERFVKLSFLWACLPLTMLLSARLGVGALRGADDNFAAMLLAFFVLTSCAAVYSAMVPQVLGATVRTPSAFASAYSAELLGALFGLGLLIALGPWRQVAILVIYPLILLVIVTFVSKSKALRLVIPLLTVSSGLLFVRYDLSSAERYYHLSGEGPPAAKLLFREDSAVQKVDVLQDGADRYLFLNGVEYFSPGALDQFNFYLSELPARALGSRKVLVIGSGSMSSAGRLSHFASEVTNVEIDPVVVKASKLYFSHMHPPKEFPWTIVYADARVFLRQTQEEYDLIILDVPTSFTLQTGSLFTQEFFELARSALTPNGAMSVYLSERILPGRRESVAGPILSAFARVFPDISVIVAHDAQNSFAIGSIGQPDLHQKVDAALSVSGRLSQRLLDSQESRHEAGRFKPATLRNLRHVWEHQ